VVRFSLERDGTSYVLILVRGRGVCFTYATMFALESLSLVGESFDTSERVRRACQFLSSKQMEDGGWGETYMVSGR
jgi:lanosterol synthase